MHSAFVKFFRSPTWAFSNRNEINSADPLKSGFKKFGGTSAIKQSLVDKDENTVEL